MTNKIIMQAGDTAKLEIKDGFLNIEIIAGHKKPEIIQPDLQIWREKIAKCLNKKQDSRTYRDARFSPLTKRRIFITNTEIIKTVLKIKNGTPAKYGGQIAEIMSEFGWTKTRFQLDTGEYLRVYYKPKNHGVNHVYDAETANIF